jgi:hypothetical protein
MAVRLSDKLVSRHDLVALLLAYEAGTIIKVGAQMPGFDFFLLKQVQELPPDAFIVTLRMSRTKTPVRSLLAGGPIDQPPNGRIDP